MKMTVKKLLFSAYLRPTDVFLVGHPKSGNTWLAYMLGIILRAGDPGGQITVANIGDFIPEIHGDDLGILKHRALPNPRVFRNEFPMFHHLYPRTIYMVRDPRSVLVSYYHHYRVTTADSEMTLEAFVAKYLADGPIVTWEPGLARWDTQVAEWTNRASEASVMIVAYEALHEDRRAALERVASFCGVQAPEDAIAAAVERGSFEAMRSEEARWGAQAYLLDGGQAYREAPGGTGWFFRQGLRDGWKDELPAKARTAIEREFGPTMEALGYRPND
jgi:hypothetical protein